MKLKPKHNNNHIKYGPPNAPNYKIFVDCKDMTIKIKTKMKTLKSHLKYQQ